MAVNKNMRILLVDDQQSIRQMIADILRAVRMRNVTFAENGKIAWSKMLQEHMDLVILDWDMPVMTGIELLQKIREFEDLQKLPVLMLTAHNQKQDVLDAVKAGATNYIVKPFAPNTLYKKLEEILGEPVI